MRNFYLTAIFCLSAIFARAQDWAELYQQSVSYYNNYQSEEARTAATKALALIKTDQSELSKNHAVILRQLSIICYDLNDDVAAIAYAKEEVETLQTLGFDADVNFVNALQNLAVMRMSRSEYAAAEPLLSGALKLALSLQSEDSYEVAVARGNLAIAKFQLQQDEEAETLFESSVVSLQTFEEIGEEYFNIIYNYGSMLMEKGKINDALSYFNELEEFYSADNPSWEYAGILVKVGDALDQLGRFEQAVSKYTMARENFENLDGTKSDDYQIAMSNLSIDLQKTGKYIEATKILESLMSQAEVLKIQSPKTYSTLSANYANLLIRKGENDQAKTTLMDALLIYENSAIAPDETQTSIMESLSTLLLKEGKTDSSVILIDNAIELAETENYENRQPSLYNQKARILSNQAKYQEAEKMANKSYELARQFYGITSIQAANSGSTLADINAQLGKYENAENLYIYLLPIFENTYGGHHPEYATVVANYSTLLQLTGNYFLAEKYLRIAENIKKEAFGISNKDYLTTYENLGLLLLHTARYTDAAAIFDEILTTKIDILGEDNPSTGYTYANMAIVKKQIADYALSEKYFQKAQKIYKQSYGEAHLFYANLINNMALLYQKMGNFKAAQPLFEQAIGIYEISIGKNNPDYATALENLATLYQLNENYDKARSLLEEALQIDEKILGKNHPLYAKTLHNLAFVYEKEKNLQKSKELYSQALAIEKSVYGELHPSYASTLYNLAALEQELENYDLALGHFEQVVSLRKSLLGEDHPDYAFSLYGLASIKHKTGDFEGAKPIYMDVIAKYEDDIRTYFPALSESEKSAFYSRIKPVFDNYLDFAIEYLLLKKGEQTDQNELLGSMYDLQLATKALLLNASNKVKNRILSSGDKGLISEFNQWTALKENLVKAYAMTKEELVKSEFDISKMEQRSNELEKQLSLKSSLFASEFEKENITWHDVLESLAPDETAVELIRIKKKMKTDSVLYVALILHPDFSSPKLVVNANGVMMEGKGFKTYKNLIVYKLSDTKSYNMYWKELDESIPDNTKTLYLSADGVINKINIATFYRPDMERFVIEQYNIRLLSNTRELVEQLSPNDQNNNAEMFGYPAFNIDAQPKNDGGALYSPGEMRSSFGSEISELPGTLEEVNNIEKILEGGSWQVNKYIGLQAAEAEVKSKVSPKILHIATHGFFLEDLNDDQEFGNLASRNGKFNPLLRSGLLLAGAQNTINLEKIPGEEDGILTAYEVMNLSLDNTDLVVMSACETGLGEVKNGEGVYGLQRAFLVAGASNLIMSLWKVNDETTQMLMSEFYKNWFEGKSRLEAFNMAINAVRSEFNQPYYWGAFVMLGK